MKAEIDHLGRLVLKPETKAESFLMSQWVGNMAFPTIHQESYENGLMVVEVIVDFKGHTSEQVISK